MRYFALGLALAVAGTVAPADELALKVAFGQRYLACQREFGSDDSARLVCYDDLLGDFTTWIAEGLPDSEDCAVEDWNMTMRGSHPYMVGAMTCATGRMDYRLYDAADGAFMASGFVYFEGFAFQDYPEISSWPASVDLKYSISPR